MKYQNTKIKSRYITNSKTLEKCTFCEMVNNVFGGVLISKNTTSSVTSGAVQSHSWASEGHLSA